MTFQISKLRAFAIALCMMATVSIQAQAPQMSVLIGQSLSKIQQDNPETFLNCVAEMKRIDAMFPDSIQPKYQMALQSLNYAAMNPQAPQTEKLLAEAEQTINQIEKMQGADLSDINTLRGFFYTVRIVQDPAANGQRYYMEVIDYYDQALKQNPNNALAKQLQEKFMEGLHQATGR